MLVVFPEAFFIHHWTTVWELDCTIMPSQSGWVTVLRIYLIKFCWIELALCIFFWFSFNKGLVGFCLQCISIGLPAATCLALGQELIKSFSPGHVVIILVDHAFSLLIWATNFCLFISILCVLIVPSRGIQIKLNSFLLSSLSSLSKFKISFCYVQFELILFKLVQFLLPVFIVLNHSLSCLIHSLSKNTLLNESAFCVNSIRVTLFELLWC